MIGREVGTLSLHDIRITLDDRGIACTPFTGSSASKINKHFDYIMNEYFVINKIYFSFFYFHCGGHGFKSHSSRNFLQFFFLYNSLVAYITVKIFSSI